MTSVYYTGPMFFHIFVHRNSLPIPKRPHGRPHKSNICHVRSSRLPAILPQHQHSQHTESDIIRPGLLIRHVYACYLIISIDVYHQYIMCVYHFEYMSQFVKAHEF